MALTVRSCSFEQIVACGTLPDLLAAYAAECGVPGMPSPNAHFESYKQLSELGMMTLFGAFDGETLIGLAAVMCVRSPHYGATLTTFMESVFVAKTHRGKGAGAQLLRAALTYTREQNASGLFVSAPSGGDLAGMLANSKHFRETNRVFFKAVECSP